MLPRLSVRTRGGPRRGSAWLVLPALLGGCAAGPDFARPVPPAGDAYVSGRPPSATIATARPGGEAQFFLPGQPLPRGWWSWFGSPEIDAMVTQAFAGNPTLEAARARLRGAESTWRARRALRAPEVGVNGFGNYGSGAGGQGGFGQGGRQSGGNQGGGAPADPTSPADPTDPQQPGGGTGGGGGGGTGGGGSDPFAIYTAQLTVRYDFDLAGRNRRLIEAARATVENQRQQLQAAYLALAGNIVSTALEAAALRAQIEAREDLVRAQNRRIGLIRAQVEEGYAARAVLVTAEAEVATLRAQVPVLRAQLIAAENGLAELIGRPPAEAGIPPIRLERLRLPRSVPIALPSTLARSRPDILASEALLAVASAQVGVAEANLYPNLTLDGSIGALGIDRAVSTVFDIGANLLAPLFDGGRRRAERDVAVAAYQEALGNYRAAVLAALVQVASGIRALEQDAVALAEQTVALEAARQSFDLAAFQEREGALNPVEVLVVQRTFQDARFAYVEALARRFQDSAALFAALGPGPLDEAGLQSVTAAEHLTAARAALASGTAPAAVAAP